MIDKLLYLLALIPFAYFICHFAGRKSWIIIFSILHGILLTILTVFVFSQPGWFWHELPPALFVDNKQDEKDNADYRFIHDNFLFIDNSHNKELISDPRSDARDLSTILITNRTQLLQLFQLINANKELVDIVVGDIDLQDKTDRDDTLRMEMLKLIEQKKLLLASATSDQHEGVLHFPGSIYGNVSEKTSDRLWVSHRIFTRGTASLPYKIYTQLDSVLNIDRIFNGMLLIETDKDSIKHWGINIFQPAFTVTNEELILNGPVRHSGNPAGMNHMEETFSENAYSFTLGEAVNSRKDEFLETLQERHHNHQRNCIFIGTFTASEDLHMTLRGELHGATILINILAQLHDKAHYLSRGYLLLLTIGFIIISLFVFAPLMNIQLPNFKKWRNKPLYLRVPGAILAFIMEDLYLVLLVAISFVAEMYTSHGVNIIFLTLYLAIFSHLVKYFNPLINSGHE